MKISLITLAVIGILAAVGIAWARHSGNCAGADYPGHVTGRVSRTLDLNDDQNRNPQGFAEVLRKSREDWNERRTELRAEAESINAMADDIRAMLDACRQ